MDSKAEFQHAVEAAKQKDHDTARAILRQILVEEPKNRDAWLLFAHVTPRQDQATECLKRALALDPTHVYAQKKLAELQSSAIPTENRSAAKQSERAGISRNEAPSSNPVTSSQILSAQQPAQPPAPVPVKIVSRSLPASNQQPGTQAPKKTHEKMGIVEIVLLSILGILIVCLLFIGGTYLFGANIPTLLAAEPTPSSEVIFSVIYENVNAMNAEDISRYLATIHPKSSAYQETEDLLVPIFTEYDLYSQVSDLKIIKQTRTEVQVSFTLTTKKIRGPDFQNNSVKGVFILRLDDGVWKFYRQTIENVEYLD